MINMEKKYPVLKCNEEIWNEIKPVLENFGIINFSNLGDGSDKNDFLFKEYPYLVSNYGNYYIDKFLIGNIDNPHVDEFNTLRYLVNTKEEFLSAVAKLLGKEYSIKEQSSETKYPCIKCIQQLYDRIKDILEIVGYKELDITSFEDEPILVINLSDNFGQMSNVRTNNINCYNRYLCSNIREFLTKVCELKGFEVVYNIFVKNNDAENHYFKYVIDKENKTIEISETYNNEGECSANVTFKKRFKKKKERCVVSYDHAADKDSIVITTIPAKDNDFDKDKGSDLDIDKPMEKINIANKLKHCKKGTKLYHLMFGEVEFDSITDNDILIITTTDENNKGTFYVSSNGIYDKSYSNGECLLFPSKDNRDWNNFQVLETGHRIMVSDDAHNWFLRLYVTNNKTIRFNSNDEEDIMTLKYIVPIEDFDFTAEDITINKEKSII